MTTTNQPTSWVEAAIRAHAWVYSDGSVPPGSVPGGPNIGEVPLDIGEQEYIVMRMLRIPECVFDEATAKHFMAHLVVGHRLYDQWQLMKSYMEYTSADGTRPKFTDRAAYTFTMLEKQAIQAIGLERWCALYTELLFELHLAR